MTSAPAPPSENVTSGSNHRWAAVISILAIIITLIPYFAGYAMANGRVFMWLGYNLDDSCVYLSWMRQAAEGAWHTLNLFTTDPQHGMAPNPFFWILGRISGITHLPLLFLYHLARIVCGLSLLMLVWRFIRMTLEEGRAQKLAFLFVCFSAGLGWLPFWWYSSPPTPVDCWQPEAITFLSLYLSPLFCFSMMLQVGIVLLLLLGLRTGKIIYSLYAGLSGFLLGLTHTYDVIPVSAVWLCYLMWNSFFPAPDDSQEDAPPGMRHRLRGWVQAVIAGVITAPSVLYIYLQLRNETVFRERANVPTLSPALIWILLGYGLTLALAVFGAYLGLKRNTGKKEANNDAPPSTDIKLTGLSSPTSLFRHSSARLLVTWAVVNIAASYLPVAFQRKMMQGAHFPIAILAGAGAYWLFAHLQLPGAFRRFPIFAGILAFLLGVTNLLFMLRDVANASVNLAQTRQHRVYLQTGELAALDWLRDNTPPGTAVQPLPWIALSSDKKQVGVSDAALMCFTPGLTNRPVYCGHWGETPHYRGEDGSGKLSELTLFGTPKQTDEQRIELLRRIKVRYLVFSQKMSTDESAADTEQRDALLPMFRGKIVLPPYLKLRYSNPDADIYEVVLP